MEQKPADHFTPSSTTRSRNTSVFGTGGDMKRSASELALEEFIKKAMIGSEITDTDTRNDRDDKNSEIRTQRDKSFAETDGFLGDVCSGDLSFAFKNRDIMNSSGGVLTETILWSQNLTPKNSSISATIDSQLSICVGSPTSANKPEGRDSQARVTTSGSSREQSEDEDDVETEAGPCEQSTDPLDLKRIRRMVSNRESARRSRRRKQAHLQDLELQVEQLRGENVSLFKQLTDATQQYRDADTNNRVLKSNVEALRAKVKLAEDMVARGSLTCSLNQFLQGHLNSQQPLNNHNLRRLANVSPTITVHGDDASYAGLTISGQNSALGLGNTNMNGNIKNGIMSDAVSCVSEIWP